MAPLRGEWDAIRESVDALLKPGHRKADRVKADVALGTFMQRLQHVTVLDPACGSGNFLYVVLQKLKNLEKQVILYAMDQGLSGFLPQVGPWQLHGIEVNPYAFELAQMTVWIGWLQWTQTNGFGEPQEPILQVLDTFTNRDAILTQHADGSAEEPEWPAVEFIVSNPPFLGDKMMRGALGDGYVDALRRTYKGRVPGGADLCCYWFEKARFSIEAGKCKRAGLLATQGIRGGRNREVLSRIKETSDIFFAVSDRDWVLDGANVHISMVGFGRVTDTARILDGADVTEINANLTALEDSTTAVPLASNRGLCIIGTQKNGAFEVPFEVAREWLLAPVNPNGRPNSDVVVPWSNGLDVTRRPSDSWIVDFGVSMPERRACFYEGPFEHVRSSVKPARDANRRDAYRLRYWLHAEPRRAMRSALAGLSRFLVTPRISKHRLVVWFQQPTLADMQLVVFASDEDYFFGVVQSRAHSAWALGHGTRLETRPRYTPTTCFEPFPFPSSDERQRIRVASAARELDELRSRWLNPPEWIKKDALEFPASVDGPWARVVKEPNAAGIGTARHVRLAPVDDRVGLALKKRTLTNLYNESPAWLLNAHRSLDEAVFAAYGWDPDISDESLLAALLKLNKARASSV